MGKYSLRALRVNAGLTMKEASKKLGISSVTLRSYEKNITIPKINVITKMLEIYDVTIDEMNFLKSEQLNKHDIKI